MIKDTNHAIITVSNNSQEKKVRVSHVPCTRRISLIIIGPLLKKFSSYNHQTWRLKFIWKHLKVVVTCTSTLAWQPSFESNIFFKFVFFLKKRNWTEFLAHLIKHYFINTLWGGLVPQWPQSCAWKNFCHVLSSDLTPEPPGNLRFLFIFNRIFPRKSGRHFPWNFAEKFQNRTIDSE